MVRGSEHSESNIETFVVRAISSSRMPSLSPPCPSPSSPQIMHHVIFLARRKSRVEIRSSERHVLTAGSVLASNRSYQRCIRELNPLISPDFAPHHLETGLGALCISE